MCIIIDANVRDTLFGKPINTDAVPVMNWIFNADGRIVAGGKLLAELSRNEDVRRSLVRLYRAGKARFITGGTVNKREREILKDGLCKSDDPHVISLRRSVALDCSTV